MPHPVAGHRIAGREVGCAVATEVRDPLVVCFGWVAVVGVILKGCDSVDFGSGVLAEIGN